ncbi:DUF6376 family protein [Bacillus cereus]|uniref:DUF6376 family protein n=1 Tax=Bacillus cereus TaxID=1396 RepID=UPI003D184A12
MLKHKLVCCTLPLILIGGGCANIHSGKVEKQSIEAKSQESTTILYTEYLVNFLVDLEEANKASTKLLKLDETLNSVDMEFKSEIGDLKTSIKIFKSLDPPSKYKEEHAKLLHSVIKIDKGLDLVLKGMEDVESDDFKTGKKTVIDSATDFSKSLEEIDKLSGGKISEAIDTLDEDE